MWLDGKPKSVDSDTIPPRVNGPQQPEAPSVLSAFSGLFNKSDLEICLSAGLPPALFVASMLLCLWPPSVAEVREPSIFVDPAAEEQSSLLGVPTTTVVRMHFVMEKWVFEGTLQIKPD